MLEGRVKTRPELQPMLDEARFFVDQKKHATLVLPSVTFRDRRDLRLGERRIQVLHYDRAVTPGDAFLYLPAEKIVIAGDLLVNPVSFALSSYPTGWLRTLEKIDALDARVIIPGHGAPLHDKTLLRAHMDVMRVLLNAGKEAKARGLDPDQARTEVMPRLSALRQRITGGDAKLNQQFDVYLVDWYLHRVLEEQNGPLSDAIAPIPPK